MLKVIFELFVLYLVYKLIFDFIIPVYKTTKQVNKKMGEMQRKMNDHFNQQESTTSNSTEKTAKPASKDYIEFEEVK